MAKKFRLDLRKELRAIAAAIQDQNAERLLASEELDGSPLAPRVLLTQKTKPSRLRIAGVLRKRADLVGRVGIKTGAMLRDLVKRSNVHVSRTAMKIVPSPEVFRRWIVFNRGSDKRQAARPVSGIASITLDQAKDILKARATEQIAAHLKDVVL